jgi:hypothetical protein
MSIVSRMTSREFYFDAELLAILSVDDRHVELPNVIKVGRQHVEAYARDDRGEPSGKIVDACRIGAAQSQPRFLNDIVHIGQRTEHPVRDGAQVGSVLFESLGQIIAFAHRSHNLVAFLHSVDGRAASNVTGGQ